MTRLDPDPKVVWTTKFDGDGLADFAYDIAVGPDDRIAAGGDARQRGRARQVFALGHGYNGWIRAYAVD